MKNAIAEGDDLESAMRKTVATAAKEAVESLLRTEARALLGYAKYDPEGRNSGDSRNISSKVRSGDKADVADGFMAIAKQKYMGSGKSAMASFVAKWRAKYPKLGIWAEKTENVLTFYEFPEGLRRLIYTNNRIQSFNKQIKRLAKKQIQFVTEEALEKRIVSMFLHCNEGVGRRKVRCWREIAAYYEAK